MEYDEPAAKRRKKRKKFFDFAPFALFCGCSVTRHYHPCHRLFSKPSNVMPI
jgi:hypothetical protein